jgi:hypothetical protein
LDINPPKPLNTDKTMTNAIVPTATPNTDRAEITFMALCDFFENKYRRAMRKEKPMFCDICAT